MNGSLIQTVVLAGTLSRKLKKDMQKSRRAAFAQGTRSNIMTQWRTFVMFCTFFKFAILPTSLDTICLYAQFLSRSFKTTAAIKNYISGVKLLHLYADQPFPHIGSFGLQLVLKGLARLNPHCPKQAFPITPPILLQFVTHLNLAQPTHATLWCLYLFAFFLMARKSNLVPLHAYSFDISKQLARQHVQQTSQGLVVSFHWSKTIQFGQRILQIPLLPIPSSPLCPVTAYLNMCKMISVPQTYPLFSLPHNSKICSITYKQLQTSIKQLITLTGRDPNQYSSHSFRRGGATWAFKAKVPADLIQLQGDWHSDAYKQYLHFDMKDKARVANSMIQLINSTCAPHYQT
jgi:integrase